MTPDCESVGYTHHPRISWRRFQASPFFTFIHASSGGLCPSRRDSSRLHIYRPITASSAVTPLPFQGLRLVGVGFIVLNLPGAVGAGRSGPTGGYHELWANPGRGSAPA